MKTLSNILNIFHKSDAVRKHGLKVAIKSGSLYVQAKTKKFKGILVCNEIERMLRGYSGAKHSFKNDLLEIFVPMPKLGLVEV